MKYLITLMLACLSFMTYASDNEVAAYKGNKAGGEITLFKVKGNCPGDSLQVITRHPGGDFYRGCWTLKGNYVHVIYSTGEERMYTMSGWILPDDEENPSKPTKPSKAL